MGVMKMVSCVEINWVADLVPNLKDKIDVARLSGKQPELPEEVKKDHEEIEAVDVGKKNGPSVDVEQLQEQIQPALSKEEKLKQLKERF